MQHRRLLASTGPALVLDFSQPIGRLYGDPYQRVRGRPWVKRDIQAVVVEVQAAHGRGVPVVQVALFP